MRCNFICGSCSECFQEIVKFTVNLSMLHLKLNDTFISFASGIRNNSSWLNLHQHLQELSGFYVDESHKSQIFYVLATFKPPSVTFGRHLVKHCSVEARQKLRLLLFIFKDKLPKDLIFKIFWMANFLNVDAQRGKDAIWRASSHLRNNYQ